MRILRAEEYDQAIAAWKESIALQPSSPDAHTSTSCLRNDRVPAHFPRAVDLASAYIVSPVSRPDLALHHLRYAVMITQAFTLQLT